MTEEHESMEVALKDEIDIVWEMSPEDRPAWVREVTMRDQHRTKRIKHSTGTPVGYTVAAPGTGLVTRRVFYVMSSDLVPDRYPPAEAVATDSIRPGRFARPVP